MDANFAHHHVRADTRFAGLPWYPHVQGCLAATRWKGRAKINGSVTNGSKPIAPLRCMLCQFQPNEGALKRIKTCDCFAKTTQNNPI